ncbi:Helper of Tim protein 13 [Spathaspora sp. JA1]|nr:Helper of Tim protein 13 [Spathaspora sp. JA1]
MTDKIISTSQSITPSITLQGQLTDKHTRCIHYHSKLDIIALKFKCCQIYYPCFKCHQELTNHKVSRYNSNDLATVKVILCGECFHELSFDEYKNNNMKCVYCHNNFNPGCSLHLDLYFDIANSDIAK